MTPPAQRAWPPSWPAALAWALWALTLLSLAAAAGLERLLCQDGRSDLA